MKTINPDRKSFETLAKTPTFKKVYNQAPEPSDIWFSEAEPSGILFESMANDDVVLKILLDNAIYNFEETTGRKPSESEIISIKFRILSDEFAKVSIPKKNYQTPRCVPRAVNTHNFILDYNIRFIAGLVIIATSLSFMIISPKAPIEEVELSPERISEIYNNKVQPKTNRLDKTPYKPEPISSPVSKPGFYN